MSGPPLLLLSYVCIRGHSMKTRARLRNFRWLLSSLLLLTAPAAIQCNGKSESSRGPNLGSETHFFLKACVSDADCRADGDEKLSCLCGTCTSFCTEDSSCRTFVESAVCTAPECNLDNPVCDVECTEDVDCGALSSDHTCFDGYCRYFEEGAPIGGGGQGGALSSSGGQTNGSGGEDSNGSGGDAMGTGGDENSTGGSPSSTGGTSMGGMGGEPSAAGGSVAEGGRGNPPGCAPLVASTQAWWGAEGDLTDTLGGSSGTFFGDASIVADGSVGQAFSLDGDGDYIDIPDSPNLSPGVGDFSLALWFRTTTPSTVAVLVDKRVEGVTGYALYISAGNLGFQLADGGFDNYPVIAPVNDGVWHHVVVTVDRDSTSGLVFYIDGVARSIQDPTNHPGSLTNAGPFRMGANAYSLGSYLEGDLDEVMYFSTTLAEEDVLSLYGAGADGACVP